MLSPDDTVELDLNAVRQRMIDGKLRWSALDPNMVRVVRVLVEQMKLSASEVAAELSTKVKIISSNAVIGFCHRAAPPVRMAYAPGFDAINKNDKLVKKRANTRRARQAASNNMSTHDARINAKARGNYIGVTTFKKTNTSHRMKFMRRPVTCCWAGCMKPPMGVGRPYCETHHYQSGALARVDGK